MGLTNNLGKLSNMITSTGSAVSISGTLTLATTQYIGNLQFGTSSAATLGYDAGTGAMSFNIGAGAASTSAYYKFLADGTSIVTFLKGGNVGIGTNTPSALLHLSTSGSTAAIISGTGTNVYSSLSFTNSTTGYGYDVGFGGSASIAPNSFYIYGGSSASVKLAITSGGDINMNTTSGNKLVTVKGQTGNGYYGEVRLGNVDHSAGIIGRHVSSGNANLEFWTENYSSGGYTLKMTITASGNIGAPTGTNIYNASDVRFKQNITTITNGLDKIIGLNPIKFNWIEGFEESEDGKDMLGFIAQEVQNVIPEAVESFGNSSITIGETIIDNPLRVNEKFIIPVLVKAIQELSKQNEELSNRLNKAGL
jgi:hypothetical protein